MGRTIRCGLLALAPLLWAGLTTGSALAHGIESRLSPLRGLSDALLLQSQFSNGEPTRDAVVRLVPPHGEPLELGRTDQHGQLSFALPKGAHGSWELQVDGGPGHRDYLEMPLRRGQAQLDQVSEQPRPARAGGWLVGLSGLGAAAMLLGLQRTRRTH
jgi:nickel transport protein